MGKERIQQVGLYVNTREVEGVVQNNFIERLKTS